MTEQTDITLLEVLMLQKYNIYLKVSFTAQEKPSQEFNNSRIQRNKRYIQTFVNTYWTETITRCMRHNFSDPRLSSTLYISTICPKF